MAQRPDVAVDGASVESTWGNTVRQQIVTPFTSTTQRSSEIYGTTGNNALVNGMVSTLATTDSTHGLYVYNGANWRAPWNLPWGYVPISALPSSFSFSTTIGYSATFTWSAVDNRNYLVTFGAEFQNGTVTGVMDTAAIYTNASPPVAVSYAGIRASFFDASSQETRSTSFVFQSTSTSTLTWKFGAISNGSTTSQTLIPNLLTIVDIGPNGAPV